MKFEQATKEEQITKEESVTQQDTVSEKSYETKKILEVAPEEIERQRESLSRFMLLSWLGASRYGVLSISKRLDVVDSQLGQIETYCEDMASLYPDFGFDITKINSWLVKYDNLLFKFISGDDFDDLKRLDYLKTSTKKLVEVFESIYINDFKDTVKDPAILLPIFVGDFFVELELYLKYLVEIEKERLKEEKEKKDKDKTVKVIEDKNKTAEVVGDKKTTSLKGDESIRLNSKVLESLPDDLYRRAFIRAIAEESQAKITEKQSRGLKIENFPALKDYILENIEDLRDLNSYKRVDSGNDILDKIKYIDSIFADKGVDQDYKNSFNFNKFKPLLSESSLKIYNYIQPRLQAEYLNEYVKKFFNIKNSIIIKIANDLKLDPIYRQFLLISGNEFETQIQAILDEKKVDDEYRNDIQAGLNEMDRVNETFVEIKNKLYDGIKSLSL